MVIVLIGEGTLALRCLHSLSERGLTPAWLGSCDNALAAAAAEHGLPHLQDPHEMAARLVQDGCDLLFSACHSGVLPPPALAAVRHCAIGCHDSLLPAYAGTHAPSWALMHGENEHGVSWHRMTGGLHEGMVLAQLRFAITPQDTAFSLEGRCVDAALRCFEQLIEPLQGADDSVGASQIVDLWPPLLPTSVPSHFAAHQRPEAQGLLDCAQTARHVTDTVRALDFGPRPNPLCLPKLGLPTGVVLVRSAHALAVASTATAGTLVAWDASSLQVATTTHDVRLGDLAHPHGEPLSTDDMKRLIGLHLGRRLPTWNAALQARLSDRHQRVCQHEDAWVELLATGVMPVGFPLETAPPSHPDAARPAAWQRQELPGFTAALDDTAPALRGLRACSALAAYAVRVRGHHGPQDLGWLVPEPGPAFAPVVPLRCPAGELSFADFEAAFKTTWERVRRQDTFALDLFARMPALQGQRSPAHWPWAVWMSDEAPAPERASHAGVLVWLSNDGQARLLTPAGTPRDTAVALDAQLTALTRATLDTPELATRLLPLMTAAERERLLVTWNDTAAPLPDTSVQALFEAQARRTPDAPALSFGTERLTYAELDAQAQQWAGRLNASGVGRGDLVALAVQRSTQMVVGLLAILKAGAAYVPVDCQLPAARIASLLARSRPRLILTHSAARDLLPPDGTERLCFDADAMTQPRPVDLVTTPADDLAYVIFTSGSTGEPKGVEIRHRSLVNHGLFMARQYGLGPGDRLLCSASIGFDVAAEQIYPALFSGAEVVVRPDDLLETFQSFDRFVREQSLTALTLPTAYWHEWVRDLEARQLTVPPSLRVLAVGTEKAFGTALGSWRERGGRAVRFLQGYGPTETTVTCTMYVHDEAVPLDPDAPLPIGRPLPNTEVYLLDEAMQPVPVGLPGELHVGGAGLARGYLGRPDLTAERFIPHPFRDEPGARLYKTGDVARYLPDGQLLYIGRADFQIKLRGFRMEPAEIEAVLRAHAGVQECLVMLREDTPGLPQLVAYLVADPDAVDLTALQQHCRAHLPAPMQPAAYVVLRAFALNGNGKVDRAALPAPALPEPDDTEADATPANAAEQTIALMFAQVLGRPSVGLHASFFDLGGSSLQAVRLLSCVEAHFALPLALTDLLSNPTAARLAQRIGAGSRQVAEPAVIELKPGIGTPLFLVAGCPIYQSLAQVYRGPQPVYALLLPVEGDLLRNGAALPSLAELADGYLRALRAHTPHGPYALGGLSFGGVVAYEMAQRLRAEGEQVPLLALFDTILPRARLRDPLSWVRKRWQQLQVRAWQALGQPVDTEALRRLDMDAHRQREIRRLLADHDTSLQPYAGPTVLYRAQDTRLGRGRAGHGFHGLVADLTEQTVAGDHLSMLDGTHAHQVADDIAQRLQRHQAAAQGSDSTRKIEGLPA